jgi:hypothetical protein
MRKWILNFIKRLAQFQIIMGKTTLKSVELIEDVNNINKGFKDKLDQSETNQIKK